jgi:hypothetical protein
MMAARVNKKLLKIFRRMGAPKTAGPSYHPEAWLPVGGAASWGYRGVGDAVALLEDPNGTFCGK